MSKKPVPIVVTTAHRGVFFGYGIPTDKPTIRIEKARMCVYWDAETRGINGLAANGPGKGCRVSPAIPGMTLRDVTAVFECSDEAAKAWENQPWS